jgi:hypothetical protein
VSPEEAWRWGRADRRAGEHNPPPKLPEFGGADDLIRQAYGRGWLGFRLYGYNREKKRK